jgi:hypothetical protein
MGGMTDAAGSIAQLTRVCAGEGEAAAAAAALLAAVAGV